MWFKSAILLKIDIQSKIRDIIAEKFKEIQNEKQQSEDAQSHKLTHDMVLQEIKKKGKNLLIYNFA